MSYTSIRAGIVSMLQTVSGIQQVYNYEAKELAKYPAATVTNLSHKNLFADTARNRRQYSFMIRLYFRTDVAQDAETILSTITDAVIVKIESDPTLGGVCDFAEPSEGKWLFQEREVPLRLVEIVVTAMKQVLR